MTSVFHFASGSVLLAVQQLYCFAKQNYCPRIYFTLIFAIVQDNFSFLCCQKMVLHLNLHHHGSAKINEADTCWSMFVEALL